MWLNVFFQSASLFGVRTHPNISYEHRCEKTGPGFPTRSDINRAAQPQKMTRGLRFRVYVVEGLYYLAKTKALISFVVTGS